ncbi:MAG: dihydrolipoyl dehydrogenase [Sphingobacteriia bacterium]|nr:dihydrolipoyl dehydrogenase [Sphingobacteriia bacterium]
MADTDFDVIVIGGGPAGYVGAIRLSQLGFKTACIEARKTLGGTCLNVGCIPSKALLQSSELFEEAKHTFKNHGISVSGLKLELEQMLARKDKVVNDLTKGIEGLFKKNKVAHFIGTGFIKSANQVTVKDGKNETILNTKNIMIATGSEVATLPGIEIDEKQIVSSTGALSLPKVPESMIVIGGGYIGLEMGSVWRRLGSQVTVVEFLDKIVPTMDSEIGKLLHKELEKQGMQFKLGTKVISAEKKKGKVILTVEPAQGGKQEKIETEVVLVAVGRRPFTGNLGLENVGIKTDKAGRIEVDDHFRTNVPNIYAVGDVIRGPMLAHKAEEEAVAAAEIMAGQAGHVNYDTIPGVIYTYPEVASVGKTEDELKASGVSYKAGNFPFLANSRARAVDSTAGKVKILADAKTDRILGAHIIGPDAGTLIAELVAAIEFGASSEDIARVCHAHPTLNEAVKEAALSVLGRTLNM